MGGWSFPESRFYTKADSNQLTVQGSVSEPRNIYSPKPKLNLPPIQLPLGSILEMPMATPASLDVRGSMTEGKKKWKETIILTICIENMLLLQIQNKILDYV